MKRITSVLLVLTFVCVLCACGSKTAGDVQNTETEAKQDMTSSEPAEGEIYTSGQSNDGVPAPLSMTGLIINTPISLYKCNEHLTDGFSSPDLEYGYYGGGNGG